MSDLDKIGRATPCAPANFWPKERVRPSFFSVLRSLQFKLQEQKNGIAANLAIRPTMPIINLFVAQRRRRPLNATPMPATTATAPPIISHME